MEPHLIVLLMKWREPRPDRPGITEVFLAALGVNGDRGFQCELGFGDGTTEAFQAASLYEAVEGAYWWAKAKYDSEGKT